MRSPNLTEISPLCGFSLLPGTSCASSCKSSPSSASCLRPWACQAKALRCAGAPGAPLLRAWPQIEIAPGSRQGQAGGASRRGGRFHHITFCRRRPPRGKRMVAPSRVAMLLFRIARAGDGSRYHSCARGRRGGAPACKAQPVAAAAAAAWRWPSRGDQR